jgi:hypothetical protein
MNGDQHPGLDVDDLWQAVEACFGADRRRRAPAGRRSW